MPTNPVSGPRGPRGRAAVLVSVILITLACFHTARRWPHSSGIDFYQFWGVARVAAWSNGTAGSPYAHAEDYAGALRARLSDQPDSVLAAAMSARTRLDLTGTPLLYAGFRVYPSHYQTAFALHRLVELAAFAGGMLLSAKALGAPAAGIIPVAALLVAGYEPLRSDLNVGNVNGLQLFVLAFLAWMVTRGLERPWAATVAMATAVLLVLAKPNLWLVAILLTAHVASRVRRGSMVRVASGAIAAGIGAIVWSSGAFGGLSAWRDWFHHVIMARGDRLGYAMAEGNSAAGMMLAKLARVSPSAGLALVGSIGIAAMIAAVVSRPAGTRLDSLRSLYRDGHLAISVGVLGSMTLSPVVWNHYYTLTLAPALWLLIERRDVPWARGLAIAAALLSSGLLPDALRATGVRPVPWLWYGLSMIPLWAGLVFVTTLPASRAERRDCPPDRCRV